ncbi:MAG: hypothetical protein CL779_03370 [Chloroflexi bacterium]|nr:hypothetical protein [Chloroflexota bacterium]|tara:strand:+ start:707 stop:1717 length:1011 start_codon:yes stop_codon:yes gene_type:complete
MDTQTKFIWKVAESYRADWRTTDNNNGLQVGYSFTPNGQYQLYQPFLAAEHAPYELGYVAYSIRHRHLGIQTDKTKKLWNAELANGSSFSISDALSMKNPSTREMLGSSKSIVIDPQNASQKRRRAINDLLIKRISNWVTSYGLLSNKTTIYLDEWTTTSLEFEWIFTYSSLIRNLINTKNFSSETDVLFRPGIEENFPTAMKLGEATKLINDFIASRLNAHTESHYSNFEYTLMPNHLTGAMWMIVANHLKNKIFYMPCINQFTPCLQFLPDSRPGRQGNPACSNACRQRAFYWKQNSDLISIISNCNESAILYNALLEKDARLSDPFGQIKSMK